MALMPSCETAMLCCFWSISSSEILQVPDAVTHQEVPAVRKGETQVLKDRSGRGWSSSIRKPRLIPSLSCWLPCIPLQAGTTTLSTCSEKRSFRNSLFHPCQPMGRCWAEGRLPNQEEQQVKSTAKLTDFLLHSLREAGGRLAGLLSV